MSFVRGNDREKHTMYDERVRDIYCARRTQDSIWDFFHMHDTAASEGWLGHTINIIRGELPETLRDKYAPLLDWLEKKPWTHLHYAIWFTCLTMYKAMTTYLIKDPSVARPDEKFLAIFLTQNLPQLVDKWLSGHFASTQSFVMFVRAEYVFSVPCLV